MAETPKQVAKFELTVLEQGNIRVAPTGKKAALEICRFEEIQRILRKQLRECFNMVIDINIRKRKA
ncbi:hypothetical protein AUJ66_02570 [Candidatus Desantisbacteria bacterium CG1_02_38_46]|uniref:Uncharacterized protein n=2 Tax=unclassified Candidatus Desantisiibacteriota TaxID=3106372 RepID=A0A1J4SDS3_9BACT|nr:MAG: hypothetical protein AUJ66_02570 [Candidatus Desantisbacteria bacterium CG1_02_38_46]PIU52081.1 MAG: hypothetical protein COS91_00955 [Candidatus Desantisbacteria bacterium CG07_land_8_20_14_0_80_39_15]